nr:glycosyltransferase [Phyllobacterium myrsinacearum]
MPVSGRTAQKRRICVGTITRNRPLMLQNLFKSYAHMRVPEGTRVRFLVVENNEQATLQGVVDTFRTHVPFCPVQYEVEPRFGIAFARNRVLEYAIDAGDDFLAFADDDECVDADWLVQLLAERDAFDLDIVGSPVRLAPAAPETTLWQKMIWSGMNLANKKSEAKYLSKRSSGQAHRIRIATGSWMGNLAFFRRTGVRFDNGLALAGGEDWRLWADASRLGAKTGWTPTAIAYETVPQDRLTFAYQYRRSRDISVIEMRAKLKSRRIITLVRLPGSLIGRMLSVCLYLMAVPFTRGRTLVKAASRLGSIVGLLRACLGRESAHYNRIDGA